MIPEGVGPLYWGGHLAGGSAMLTKHRRTSHGEKTLPDRWSKEKKKGEDGLFSYFVSLNAPGTHISVVKP